MNQFGGGFNFLGAMPAAAPGPLISKNDKEGVSMFKMSIRGGQQSLAQSVLENGYDVIHAMQDAMDEKKFKLVVTLLSKNPYDKVIQ